jgi:integrase
MSDETTTAKTSHRSTGTGSLFKRTGSRTWTASYYLASGDRKTRSTGTTDKRTAQRLLDRWVSAESLRREGLHDPSDERFRDEGSRSIEDHLTEWRDHLTRKGSTEKHAQRSHGLAKRLIDATKAERLPGLSAEAVHREITDRLESGDSSPRTCQAMRTAIKGFSRWAHRTRRTREDLLIGLPAIAQTERRYERRALSTEEAGLLIETTSTAPAWRGITGPERAMLYTTAAGTGFRRSELAALRVRDFHLDGDRPFIRLEAGSAKNRKATAQPIRLDLAAKLTDYLDGRKRDVRAFTVHKLTGLMMRLDLRRAKAAWIRATTDPAERRERLGDDFLAAVDGDGRVLDFHSWRSTYITGLVRSGASVKVTQQLARHSTPTLTLNLYGKLGIHDLTGALEALPAMATSTEAEDGETLLATGTEARSAGAARAGQNSAFQRIGAQSWPTRSGSATGKGQHRNTLQNQRFQGSGGGFSLHSTDHGPVAESADAADLKSASTVSKGLPINNLEDDSGEAQRSAQRARTEPTPSEHTDPDLDRLAAAWPTLPEPIRRAMLAMVDSTE